VPRFAGASRYLARVLAAIQDDTASSAGGDAMQINPATTKVQPAKRR
jgi:hypothetical protein